MSNWDYRHASSCLTSLIFYTLITFLGLLTTPASFTLTNSVLKTCAPLQSHVANISTQPDLTYVLFLRQFGVRDHKRHSPHHRFLREIRDFVKLISHSLLLKNW